ncbi:hypothetical protein QYE76_003654 [Lolium multiflorum]|uniref:DYW domain-containing protein n=1 Tax=Lolium multiflorum TaxID=4521 RepID=A0AAD8RQZ1_LOLMU|nr:hypothetical protein QYE76_003654 [Lolium multiflorum]
MSCSRTSTLRAADGKMLQGVEKVPAYSWVELSGKVHEFCVGDKSHALMDQICQKLDELVMEMKNMDYKPTTDVVIFDVEDEEKEQTLVHHSEKLAIAFCLLNILYRNRMEYGLLLPPPPPTISTTTTNDNRRRRLLAAAADDLDDHDPRQPTPLLPQAAAAHDPNDHDQTTTAAAASWPPPPTI